MTIAICLILALTASANAQTAMWGGSPGRNQVSDEQNLPTTWDVETGTNVKWSATLGSQTYAGPLIAGDKIFVGTNNQAERAPLPQRGRRPRSNYVERHASGSG